MKLDVCDDGFVGHKELDGDCRDRAEDDGDD